ncbi:MAG: FAD-binding oxidoreductase [Myxococcales bacterium]|nr:FAD-binding oxidoreductase [Myxococcales bacterium]
MSWTSVDDPQLGVCQRADAGARLVEPLDAAGLAQLLGEYRGAFTPTVGPPPDPGGRDRVWVDLSPFSGVGPVTDGALAVQAGGAATWGAVEGHLAAEGLTLGPVPGALWDEPLYVTLARGARRRPSPRFGELLDNLLAVKAALPGGGLTRSAVTPRRATGPDLARGLLGAGHRAGIPVSVHLQAWPRSPVTAWRAVGFAGWAEALHGGVAALHGGARPAWWRFAAQGDRVVCLAGFAGEAGLARFDEAMGGHPLDPGLARALGDEVFGPGVAAHPLGAAWSGPVSEAIGRAEVGSEIWDLRPEGVTVLGAATGPDPGWASLADAALGVLEGGP